MQLLQACSKFYSNSLELLGQVLRRNKSVWVANANEFLCETLKPQELSYSEAVTLLKDVLPN